MKVYGYARGSTEEQEATLEAQEERIKAEFAHRYQPKGYAWGGVFIDKGVSGSRALRRRPEGVKLCAELRRGDVLVITKLDRGFRNARDFFEMMEYWKEQGVGLCLLDLDIDTSTPVGELMAGMMAIVAQFERRRIAERTKDVIAHRRKQGKPIGKAPYGWVVVGKRGQKRFMPDGIIRAVADKIVEWVDAGWTFNRIYFHMIKHKVKRADGSGEYSEAAIKRIYHAEKGLRELEARGIFYPVWVRRMLKEQNRPH